jgi:hypothetical protein
MSASIESEKSKIERKIEALKMRERVLEERAKRKAAKQLIEVGKLAERVGITSLTIEELLGAFLELSEKSKRKDQLEEWKERASRYNAGKVENEAMALIVQLKSSATQEVKNALKKLGFKWNDFRKEWYGYGIETSVRAALDGIEFELTKVNN